MTNLQMLDDPQQIAAYLGRFADRTIYQLGDLDPFFWPATRWYGLVENDEIQALVLLYTAPDPPVLLAMTLERLDVMNTLMHGVQPHLPPRCYAHLSDDVTTILAQTRTLVDHGQHFKMVLRDQSKLPAETDLADVVQLGTADLAAIEQLYAHYHGNWFDQRMLETGCYFGVWHDHELVSIAGIHVYSPVYRVAALGNITTHPAFRGRGLARRTTAKLCHHLLQTVDTIGLNVKCDNAAALACYRGLGFEIVATYGEWEVELIV